MLNFEDYIKRYRESITSRLTQATSRAAAQGQDESQAWTEEMQKVKQEWHTHSVQPSISSSASVLTAPLGDIRCTIEDIAKIFAQEMRRSEWVLAQPDIWRIRTTHSLDQINGTLEHISNTLEKMSRTHL